jgi:hypothetical protein
LLNALEFKEFNKIPGKIYPKTIFDGIWGTYEGNQQIKEAKGNLLVEQYESFKVKDDEDIETMLSRFQVMVSGMKVLDKICSIKIILIRFLEVFLSSGDPRLQTRIGVPHYQSGESRNGFES